MEGSIVVGCTNSWDRSEHAMSSKHADAFCATVVLLESHFGLTSLAHETNDPRKEGQFLC